MRNTLLFYTEEEEILFNYSFVLNRSFAVFML